ncbi:MAG TPA: glutamate synthase-related protein, partial [Anaerolineae bacterium]|nr:glutamate synthase-related protein [Anaerolineae bacterium]
MPLANSVAKWWVARSDACTHCNICVEVCPTAAHIAGDGFVRMPQPKSELCIGPNCRSDGRNCVTECPADALRVESNQSYDVLGDARWPADLLNATWHEAEYGTAPRNDLEWRIGRSGGGFDRMRFKVEDDLAEVSNPSQDLTEAYRQALSEVDMRLPLNRRHDDAEAITINTPWYGGGMSYGSISLSVMLARASAAERLGYFISTGEGGYPIELSRFKDNVITQVATGLFGVREETLQWARIIEIKYAQGAKPGLGGHLLADKVTRDVAEVREAVEHTNLFSPFPFHSVYSVEDHKKHLDWLRAVNPRALISVKVSTPEDVDMVAVGSYYAGAHIIHLDGGYGGTGAAPDIAKKNIAMPIEY